MPVDGGATLLWLDVTASAARRCGGGKSGHAARRLAAESANDGLWEWDLRTQECFFSGRWKAMVGLAGDAGAGHPNEWFARVHHDDAAVAEGR